jgi:hypothetical protein
MSYQFWHNCFRLSSVVFPASTVMLFFAPRGTEQSALLAATAVASVGAWAYSSGRRLRRRSQSQGAEGESA